MRDTSCDDNSKFYGPRSRAVCPMRTVRLGALFREGRRPCHVEVLAVLGGAAQWTRTQWNRSESRF
jgi:hypothetical protein